MQDTTSFGVTLSDKIARFVGSWRFIIIQSVIITIWVILNLVGLVWFDRYPFILLNLFMSLEAAYATPVILMASNRQAEKDRLSLLEDLKIEHENSEILFQILKEVQDHKTMLSELAIIKDQTKDLAK